MTFQVFSAARGSLFVYVVNAFEIQARALVIGLVGKDALKKGTNLEQIGNFLNSNLPATIDPLAIERLTEYKYVRDACAHSEGQVTRELYKLLKVSDAVKKIPGVIFQPLLQCGEDETSAYLSSFTPEQLAVGRVEFTNEFIPTAIAFFQERFERITE